MAFKTFAPGVLTSSDVNTFLMRQSVIVCTSSTRPGSPNEGMTIYETDTKNYLTYSGTAWIPLVQAYDYSFTPTLSGTGWTFKGYSSFSKVARIGRMVHYLGYVLWDGTGSQTAGAGAILVDLPVNSTGNPTAFARLSQHGVFAMIDVSASVNIAGLCRANAANELFIMPTINDAGIGAVNNYNTGITASYLSSSGQAPTDANDRWYWSVIYEAA
jgi:hypothetical protein